MKGAHQTEDLQGDRDNVHKLSAHKADLVNVQCKGKCSHLNTVRHAGCMTVERYVQYTTS